MKRFVAVAILFLCTFSPVPSFSADVVLPSYNTPSDLPSPGTVGRLARVADEDAYNAGGIFMDNGSQWFKVENNLINARFFAGVTGKCTNDQIVGLTSWLNAVKQAQAQNLNLAGYLPAGCYRYTSVLPDISTSGMMIIGEGRRSVLFNAATGTAALTVTGQNVRLQGITIEGIPTSGHGIRLNESHYFSAIDVVVSSAGNDQHGWRVEGVITLTCIDCRGTCNVPGCQLYTTDITDNGSRGIVGRALNLSDGATQSNNDHAWIGFKSNGGHSGHGVIIGGSSTGIFFYGGVFETAPVGFNVIVWTGSNVKNSGMFGPYISVGSGLGLEINNAVGITIIGGQSNGHVTIRGNARSNTFVNHEFNNLDVLVSADGTPRMNAFHNCRITGTITDNGTNTVFVGNTDNTNTPKENKIANLTLGGGANITKHFSASVNLDFGSIAANSCSSLAMTVTGAADGDTVALGIPNALASIAGLAFTGFVSSTNTVTVKACNVKTSATGDLPAAVIRADIWRH